MSANGRTVEGDGDPGDGRDTPLSDQSLLDLLDSLVNNRGRVAASEALGVNYRTLVNCYESRRVSRRMRQVLQEFRDAEAGDGEPEVVDGDGEAGGDAESVGERVAALEAENRELRETAEAHAGQLEELGRRVTRLEERAQQGGDAETVGVDEQQSAWRPPRRGHGMPDAGVVTLEQQLDEGHAFGPAAPLVAEWRELRVVGETAGSRFDRAKAGVRRWELETELLRGFHLTLPPETEPLDEAGRADHLRWRQDALAEARRELNRAERARLLRRALTLGMWWK